MRVAVIGATGVLGRHVVPRLVEAGHDVRATYRRDDDGARLNRLGVAAIKADILDRRSLAAAVEGCDAALHLATRIPPPAPDADWSVNDRIRREGTENLLAACAAAGCERYVQQSIAMLLNTANDRPQTEDDPVAGPAPLASAVDAEMLVRACPLDWRIVRGGAFYGPGTGLDDRWRQAGSEGALAVPGDGAAYVSLIHVADMAAAVLSVLEADVGWRIWNAVDDEPAPIGAVLDHVASLAGSPPPVTGAPPGLPSFRVSNARLRSELGWSPRFGSYRSGLAA